MNERGADVDAPRGKMKGVNVAMRYVETASGEIIEGNRAADIRRFARSIWVFIGKERTPPATWGSADIKTKEYYCREMRNLFEELGLCDLDWKAEQIATDNYPSWRATWTKQNSEKKPDTDLAVPVSKHNANAKRLRCDSTKVDSKRKKMADGIVEHDTPVEVRNGGLKIFPLSNCW